jgi:hypothetical protein
MFRHFVIYPILLVMFLAVPLQAIAAQRAPVVQEQSVDGAPPAKDDTRQRRRAGLREELRAQNGGATPAPQRQLSPQDRADLRQQLRQQRRDDNRQ